jgi:hypothetical protein
MNKVQDIETYADIRSLEKLKYLIKAIHFFKMYSTAI